MWHHVRDTEPRARKEHKCWLCGFRIRKGAKHIHRFGFYDGAPTTMRMHGVCHSVTLGWDQDDWDSAAMGGLNFAIFELDLVHGYRTPQVENRP